MTFVPEILLREEVLLLLPVKWNQKLWQTRCRMWDCHITQFAVIQCEGDPVRATRINFVKDHLDVLDRKFGVLLQFQALVATAGSIIFTGLYKAGDGNSDYSRSFKHLLGVMCVLWVVDALLCLYGIRRLLWGDMWHFKVDPGTHPTPEQVQVGALRTEVIKRTAKFRVAVTILVYLVTLLPGLIYAAVRKRIDLWPFELLLLGLIVAGVLVHRQHRERPFDPYTTNAETTEEATAATVT